MRWRRDAGEPFELALIEVLRDADDDGRGRGHRRPIPEAFRVLALPPEAAAAPRVMAATDPPWADDRRSPPPWPDCSVRRWIGAGVDEALAAVVAPDRLLTGGARLSTAPHSAVPMAEGWRLDATLHIGWGHSPRAVEVVLEPWTAGWTEVRIERHDRGSLHPSRRYLAAAHAVLDALADQHRPAVAGHRLRAG